MAYVNPDTVHLHSLALACYEASKAKGFYAPGPNSESLPLKLVLIHSEISEALEELRKNPDPRLLYFREADHKPEGFLFEIADVIIRCLDLVGYLYATDKEPIGLPDFELLLLQKMAFNATRPNKHGKAF